MSSRFGNSLAEKTFNVIGISRAVLCHGMQLCPKLFKYSKKINKQISYWQDLSVFAFGNDRRGHLIRSKNYKVFKRKCSSYQNDRCLHNQIKIWTEKRRRLFIWALLWYVSLALRGLKMAVSVLAGVSNWTESSSGGKLEPSVRQREQSAGEVFDGWNELPS